MDDDIAAIERDILRLSRVGGEAAAEAEAAAGGRGAAGPAAHSAAVADAADAGDEYPSAASVDAEIDGKAEYERMVALLRCARDVARSPLVLFETIDVLLFSAVRAAQLALSFSS